MTYSRKIIRKNINLGKNVETFCSPGFYKLRGSRGLAPWVFEIRTLTKIFLTNRNRLGARVLAHGYLSDLMILSKISVLGLTYRVDFGDFRNCQFGEFCFNSS